MKSHTGGSMSVTITSQLTPVGSAFHHGPSCSLLLLTQDARNKKIYYLTTISNRATPNQNFTTCKITGTRDDGLLEHEIDSYVCKWECQKLDAWQFTLENSGRASHF